MKSLPIVIILLFATTVYAHFRIASSDGGIQEWITTNASGDPQKQSPCGLSSGTQTGFVKTVTAGQKLTLNWIETVPHGGHYRIAIAPDRAQLVDPVPIITMNNCTSLAIQNSPVAPVVADGVAVHGQTATAGLAYQTEITIPNTLGANTLQIIEFMTPHAPNCFYYHCVNLNIVAADAGGVGGGGGTAGGAGGSAGGGAGGGTAGGAGGAAGGGSGGAAGGGSGGAAAGGSGGAAGGGTGTGGGATGGSGGGTTMPTGGCGCSTADASTLGAAMMLAFGLLAARRRRSN